MATRNELTATVRAAMRRARVNGVDEAEYLYRYGLVLTDQIRAQLHAEMCDEVVSLISRMSVAALVGAKYHGGNWTPEDLRQGVIALVNGMKVEAMKGRYIRIIEGNGK